MGQHALTEPIDSDVVAAAAAVDAKGSPTITGDDGREVPNPWAAKGHRLDMFSFDEGRAVLAVAPVPGEGFAPVGHLSVDSIEVKRDALPDLQPWGGEPVRTLQERRELSFKINVDNRGINPAVWHALFGLPAPQPAPPTAREALVDIWDSLRALVLALVAVVKGLPRRARWLAEDVYDGVLDAIEDRWHVLRSHVWRRKATGPLVRFWDAEYTHLATMPRPLESWRTWALRQARLPLAVFRGE
ncbi:hypothetical protein SEA_TIERRA_94 [Mycobacterium phage Tierra]|nr:hypothetical protein SEA_PHRANK_94 [Mycobacterium phage Phrank]WNM68383.1 hypothetical protein SEA_TIERRA_94 [Mycobacterium phage Tierra]